MKKSLLLLAALLMVTMVSGASALETGTTIFAIELGQGTADLTNPVAASSTPSYINGVSQPELSGQLEIWHMFAEDYAFNISGGVGFFSAKQEPNVVSAVNQEITNSHTSFRVRIGGDRVGQVGDRLTLFFGPGLEYFSGKAKAKSEGGGGPTVENESSNTTRIGISGRIGGMMKVSDNVSIVGRVGHNLGYATSSADNGNAKITWWPSSFDAAWGLAFGFGSQ